jgi:ketosteroid isomerase-like protein
VKETPDEVVDELGIALRTGAAADATALFSLHGCFVTPDSTVIHGRSEVRDFLRQLVEMIVELTIEQRTMLTAGDIAVSTVSWSMQVGRGVDAVRRTSRSTIVLGRIEGDWRIAVVDPWRTLPGPGAR